MAGKTIVITSGKGGVGKTTSSANIGTALAMRGHDVCLIDTDIGLRNLDVVLGLENRIVYDLVDVIEETCRLEQAMIRDKQYDGLYLLPAAQTRDKNSISGPQMKKVIEELKEQMDYIIVDSPAGIEQGFKNAIAGADHAIIVTTPEVSAIRDADRIIGLLEAEGLNGPQVIINRIRADMVDSGNMMNIDDITDILAVDLVGIVPEDENVVMSTNKGEPVATNERAISGKAYRNIADRITGKEIPMMKLEKEGFFSKLKKLVNF